MPEPGDLLIGEAIKRARQLAAKMGQDKPSGKRPASELDDNIGTVKVTLAYEKPPNLDNNKDSHRPPHKDSYSSSSGLLNNNINRDSNYSSRDRGRDRDDREPSSYSGSNNNNNNGLYSRNQTSGQGILSGANAFPQGQGGEEKIELIIPHAVIGLVIGKGGENIKRIQNETGAAVRVDPTTVDEQGNKVCTITGTKQAVEDARVQVTNVIDNSASNKRPRLQPTEGTDVYKMKIPAARTGAIIGKGGETIKSIKQQSGCDIELDKGAKESGAEESVFIIRGTQDKILKARQLMEARLASRGRDGDSHSRDHGRSHSSSKGVATGANAAPVAPYPDLPGQQPATDVTAAWAAYYAQYSTMMGAQTPVTPVQQAPAPAATAAAAVAPTVAGQQDFTEQWIEYYRANGRPDYAEQLIQYKKQTQQQQQQPQ